MNDPPDTSREQRRDFRFKRRYVLGNLYYVVPALIAFGFAWKYAEAGGPVLWIATGSFLACIVFGMVFDWFRFRAYRCPSCGRTIDRPTLKPVGLGTPRHYYCPACNIEWDTGLRTPSD